jgi:predicted hydrocarbon binding protein
MPDEPRSSNELEAERKKLDGLLVIMASLAHGLEHTLGRGAATVTFRAGRKIGLKTTVSEKSEDLLKALEILQRELESTGIQWPFEVWKPQDATEAIYKKDDGCTATKLVFRNCMVRCSLFRYSHNQQQSLCMMNHGVFCGYLQNIVGKRVGLEIIHAGENACLKELTISEGAP